MELLLVIGVFILSLTALVKGADWFLDSAENIGKAFGMSAFLIGVLIVGLGTSLPELVSSVFAVFGGLPEVVIANAVGSNITNILLIIGVAAIVGRKIVITKNLIDLEIPILLTSTIIFLAIAWDAEVSRAESFLLMASYGIYFLYTIYHKDTPTKKETGKKKKASFANIKPLDILWLLVGAVFLAVGANYLIESVSDLAFLVGLPPAVITITAVAIGTSLPELLVSYKAARSGKSELAVGNIYGSNAFNALMVVGVPGILGTLPIEENVWRVGLPFMAVATLMFIISCMSRRIYMWEGALFMIMYIIFIGNLLGYM
jgi:cation:H+ antiporter